MTAPTLRDDVEAVAIEFEAQRLAADRARRRAVWARSTEILASGASRFENLDLLVVHGSPSVGAPDVASSVSSVEPIVGAVSGAASFGAPDATPGGATVDTPA